MNSELGTRNSELGTFFYQNGNPAMSIARFSVNNPVLVNLLMIGLFVFGGIALWRMPKELNPPVEFNWVFITVPYPGAAPNETESLIVDKIEAEIQDVDKISEIQSTAGEGFGFLLVKFEDMSEGEFRERFSDLKAEVDKVDFPEEAEDPLLEDFGSGDFMPVIDINMAYTIPENNAQIFADELDEDLRDIPGVAKVQVSGLAEREIWVEVDPYKLNALRVTFDEIVFALKRRNLNVPGGTIAFGKTEYLIRSLSEYQSIREIENTIIRTSPDGKPVKINDVAAVNDRREEMPILSRLNGAPSITFSISKKKDANSIGLINAIKTRVRSYQQRVPDGVTFTWTNDNAVYINRIINVLRNNALTGMVLIIFVLYVFLGRENAFLASLGIPISFFITFVFMHMFGYSLNGSTLFALVMVLGIIVDDAIIVIENCHRYRLMGYSAAESAVRGTGEVVSPILSSICTNIAAFLPLILLPGIMGKFMRIVPLAFAMALAASMFESFFLLPSHYADWTGRSRTHLGGEKKFFKTMRKAYGRLLIKVLRKRYLLLPALLLVLVAAVGLIPMLGVEMYADEDLDLCKILVKLPEGTSLAETDRILRKFEDEALKLSESERQDVIVNAGLLQSQNEWLTQKNVGQVSVQLRPKEKRTLPSDEILQWLRRQTQHISGPISVEFETLSGGPPIGKPISVKVQGKYLPDIKQAALALQDSLRTMGGTYNIKDNFPPGKQEIRVLVDEEKAALFGFTAQYVALNVRYAFDGVEATEFRDGDDEIDVIVKYDRANRASVEDVLNLHLTNPTGRTVALGDMVTFQIRPGPTAITRFDQKRTIMVTGDIDESKLTLDVVNLKMLDIFPKLEERFPGITFKIGGEFEEFLNAFSNITSLFALSLVLIFVILGTQFNSYSQPFIILTTVPFSLIGAVLGLLVSGNPFSIIALFGFVALAGIVVNDAIVMIDFMNNRRSGKQTTPFQYWRSIVNAGRLRLRPIILTSLTTISGLAPMAAGIGGRSDLWSPLANVILFGILMATVLTLFVIPCLMAVLDDIKRSRKKAVSQEARKSPGLLETELRENPAN